MTIPHNIGNNGEKWYAPFFKIEHSSASRWLKTPANGHLLRPWFTWLPVLSRAWRFCTTPHCGLETRFDVKGFACWLLFFFGDVRWVFISKIDTSDTSDTSHKRVFTDTSDTSHPLKKKKRPKTTTGHWYRQVMYRIRIVRHRCAHHQTEAWPKGPKVR